MYQSLYRKYRPSNFDEVVGQQVVIKTLKNAIKNNTLSHAYLFAGPRGTGKTSIAKILAKMVNCENLKDYKPCNDCVNCTQYNNKQSLDIIEIDAASNNGVDEIREIKSKINLVPSTGKYKIYIIDEVHMLSTGAFNALLKTLEEPPKHVIFVLATTDPFKIPLTILSRCQRFDFQKISNNDIKERLKYVVKEEKIEIEDDALEEIAILSEGGMRDSLSLLDQATSYTTDKITIEDIHNINGTITNKELNEFVNNLKNNNIDYILKKIDELNSLGKDFYKLTEEIMLFLRNVLINKTVPNYFENNEYFNIDLDKSKIMNYIEILNNTLYEMKNSFNNKLMFEVTMIKLLDNKEQLIKEETKQEEPSKYEEKKDIVDIRVNNTLSRFNKANYLKFKEEVSNIDIPILKEGVIKAYGLDNFIIVFDDNKLIEEFNQNYKKYDDMLEKALDKKIKGIAVSIEDWEKIKQEFNSKTKIYEYKEEK